MTTEHEAIARQLTPFERYAICAKGDFEMDRDVCEALVERGLFTRDDTDGPSDGLVVYSLTSLGERVKPHANRIRLANREADMTWPAATA